VNDSHLPTGLTKKTKKKGGFANTFQSTILGTAVFIAEMQKKVPLRTKIAVAVFLLVVGAGTTFVVYRQRERAEAEAALASALARPDVEALPTLRQLIAESPLDDTGRIRAIERVERARDAGAVPALMAALGFSEEVRVAAALALARIGAPGAAPATERLRAILAEAGPAKALPYAWALTALGDPGAAQIVVEALPSGAPQTLPGYDTALLAAALGRERLMSYLGHADPRVRQFAAASLGPLCDPSVVPVLTNAASDAAREVRIAAMVSLGRCGTTEALQALSGALAADRSLWPALQTAFLNEVGAPAIALLLAHVDDAATRSSILTLLAASVDPRAGDAFLAELARRPDADERVRLQLAAALAEISDPRLVTVLEPVLNARNPTWTMAAIDILGRTGRPEDVEPTLVALAAANLGDRGAIRRAALAALAEAGACGPAAREQYARHAATIPGALRGLARCGDPAAVPIARPLLDRRLPRRGETTAEQGEMLLAALEVAARAHLTDLAPRLLEHATDAEADPWLRSEAGAVLGVLADEPTLDTVADRVVDARTPEGVRAALVRALRRRTPASALPRLMGYVRSGEDDARTMAATVILGEHATAGIRTELVGLLGDDRAKRNAAFALALSGDAASAEALGRALSGDNALLGSLQERFRELGFEIVPDTLLARIEHGLRLRSQNFGLMLERYYRTLREAEPGPVTPSPRAIRRMLEARTLDPDPEKRRIANEALLGLGARGILLARRAAGGEGAREADDVLSGRIR
jgi:HEAT repeat protein